MPAKLAPRRAAPPDGTIGAAPVVFGLDDPDVAAWERTLVEPPTHFEGDEAPGVLQRPAETLAHRSPDAGEPRAAVDGQRAGQSPSVEEPVTSATVDTREVLAGLACRLRDGGVEAEHVHENRVLATCGPDARAVGFEGLAGAWQACLYPDPSGAADAIDRFPLHAPDGEILLLTCHADTLYHVARTVCAMWARQV
jgi:hypothetical protein